MARNSCILCSRKHVSQFEILSCEAELGYVLHAWYAIGNLAEAESELLTDYPDEAKFIRAERIKYTEGLSYGLDQNDEITLEVKYRIDTLEIIRRLTSIEILENQDSSGLDSSDEV